MKDSRVCSQQWRCWLGLVLVLALVSGMLFPWGASAYYVEKAGDRFESDHLTVADYDDIERDLYRALEWDNDNASAYWLLAQAYQRQDNQIAAASTLARYAELQPKNSLALWEWASACEGLSTTELLELAGYPCGTDEPSRRAIVIQLWQEMGQPIMAFLQAGDRLRQSGNPDLAEAFYRRVLLLDPNHPSARYGIAQVYEARGDNDGALELYGQIISLDAEPELTAMAHERRGAMFAAAERWREASRELAKAVTLVPDEGRYHSAYGWYLYQSGGPVDTAITELRVAAEMLPDSPWPHLRLAQIASAGDDYEAMLTHAQAAVARQPTLVWAWLSQARALRLLGRPAEAEPSVRRALELAPDRAQVQAELGLVLKELGRLDEAIAALKRAVELAPDNLWYNRNLADAYRAAGHLDLATAAYRRILELDPNNNAALQALQDLDQ